LRDNRWIRPQRRVRVDECCNVNKIARFGGLSGAWVVGHR
jgi:hypothetical protein